MGVFVAVAAAVVVGVVVGVVDAVALVVGVVVLVVGILVGVAVVSDPAVPELLGAVTFNATKIDSHNKYPGHVVITKPLMN